MPSFDFSYNATPALAKQAARKYIWHRVGFWLLLNALVLMVCLVMLLGGNRSWYVFVLPAIAGMKLWAWFSSYLMAGASIEEVADNKVTVLVDDDALKMDYANAESKTDWNDSMQIQRFNELWLINFLDTDSRTYIPTDAMSNEVQAFIVEKVTESGGTVN